MCCRAVRTLWVAVLLALCASMVYCEPSGDPLASVFRDGERVDLRTSKASSVVRLREEVKLPAPATTVLVKTYPRESLPAELQPAFSKPGTVGVTVNSRYIVIIQTPFAKEHQDVLNHELVHAYISLISPKPLPFWFQEASAVYFSTNADRRIYGKPSDDHLGVTEGKVSELTAEYQQKLQSFHFLIERVGTEKFFAWYRDAVTSGIVDARPLLGLSTHVTPRPAAPHAHRLVAFGLLAGVIIVFVLVCGFIVARRGGDFG